MDAPRISGLRAMGLGLRALRKNVALWIFGVSSEAAVSAARTALVFAAFAGAVSLFVRGASTSDSMDLGDVLDAGLARATSGRLWLPVLGALVALAAVGAVLRLVYLSAAVVDASGSLKEPDRKPTPVITAASGVFGRAVQASVALWLIELAATLLRFTFWGAAFLIVSAALQRPHGGVGAALAGALAGTLGFMLLLFVDLFGRVFLVKAIRHLDQGALAAAWDAGCSVAARLSTYITISVIGALLALAGAMSLGAVNGFGGVIGASSPLLGQLVQLIGAALMAAWMAAVEIALVGAVCAVDLDERGELPAPPVPPPAPKPLVAEPVAVAEAVLVAQAIDPKPTT